MQAAETYCRAISYDHALKRTGLGVQLSGRCILCRSHIVELLASLGPLPPWILAEGRFDTDGETRILVEKVVKHKISPHEL